MIGHAGRGHLAERPTPTSVTRLHRPAGSEGSMLRSGRGHMAVITEELEQHYTGAAPQGHWR